MLTKGAPPTLIDPERQKRTLRAAYDARDHCGDQWLEAMVDTMMETMIVRAVHDAQQNEDPALRQEARTWLWICCPDLAVQLNLTSPDASDHLDGLPNEAAAYCRRQRAA